MESMETQPLSVRLTPDEIKRLKALAKDQSRPAANLAQAVLRDYLTKTPVKAKRK